MIESNRFQFLKISKKEKGAIVTNVRGLRSMKAIRAHLKLRMKTKE